MSEQNSTNSKNMVLEAINATVPEAPKFDLNSIRERLQKAKLLPTTNTESVADKTSLEVKPSLNNDDGNTTKDSTMVDPLINNTSTSSVQQSTDDPTIKTDISTDSAPAADTSLNNVEDIPENLDNVQPGQKKQHFKTLRQALTKVQEELNLERKKILDIENQKQATIQELLDKQKVLEAQLEDVKKEAEVNSTYRQAFEVEAMPEYKEKFIVPASNILGELYKYAQDYKVPTSVIDAVLRSDSVADQNKFLADKFDNVAISQMLPLINNFKIIMQQKREADKNPMELRKRLHDEAVAKETEQSVKRKESINNAKTASWDEVLKVYENIQTTKNYINKDATQTETAKKLYEEIIDVAVLNGLKVADPMWTKRIAALTQKAIVFDTVAKTLQEKEAKVAELENTLQQLQSSLPGVKRPSMSNSNSSAVSTTPKGIPDSQTLLNMLVAASK